jgi:hypothetical protein
MAHRQAKDQSKTEADSKPAQAGPSEQSGSAGRPTTGAENAQGKDTGQGRYGQSGFAGGQPHETMGQWKYRDSEKQGTPDSKSQSNRGSGRADRESQDYQRTPAKDEQSESDSGPPAGRKP